MLGTFRMSNFQVVLVIFCIDEETGGSLRMARMMKGDVLLNPGNLFTIDEMSCPQ